jgi:heme exporter protein CcmD
MVGVASSAHHGNARCTTGNRTRRSGDRAIERGSGMNHAGFIIATYGITFGVIIGLVVYTIKQGRNLSRTVADKDKPWT